MAKEITGYIKLQIKGGAANPAPPVGPALGSKGLNIMEFCKAFNAVVTPASFTYTDNDLAEVTVAFGANLVEARSPDLTTRLAGADSCFLTFSLASTLLTGFFSLGAALSGISPRKGTDISSRSLRLRTLLSATILM